MSNAAVVLAASANGSVMDTGVGPAIEITHLGKTFGSFVAVEDLTLSVQRGEIFGLLVRTGPAKQQQSI